MRSETPAPRSRRTANRIAETPAGPSAPALASAICAAALALGAVLAPPAGAISPPSAPAVMREGAEVVAPRGWTRLCERAPHICLDGATGQAGVVVRLEPETFVALEALNRDVNRQYTPMEDIDAYGLSDFWTLPGTYADCEDYVLEKRRRLIAAGWPAEALLIGVVRGTESPYHAVLIVRTEAGEWVLDNMTDEILDWRDTGYEWVIRQSSADPLVWVRIDRPVATGDTGFWRWSR